MNFRLAALLNNALKTLKKRSYITLNY